MTAHPRLAPRPLLVCGWYAGILAAWPGWATPPSVCGAWLNQGLPFLIFGLATLTCVAIEAVLIVSAIRGQSPPQPGRSRRALEVVWTIVPAGLLVVLIGLTAHALLCTPAGSPSEATLPALVVGER